MGVFCQGIEMIDKHERIVYHHASHPDHADYHQKREWTVIKTENKNHAADAEWKCVTLLLGEPLRGTKLPGQPATAIGAGSGV